MCIFTYAFKTLPAIPYSTCISIQTNKSGPHHSGSQVFALCSRSSAHNKMQPFCLRKRRTVKRPKHIPRWLLPLHAAGVSQVTWLLIVSRVPWWRSNIHWRSGGKEKKEKKKKTPSSAFFKNIKVYRLCLPLRFISFSHSAALALILPFPQLYSTVAVFSARGRFHWNFFFFPLLVPLISYTYNVLPLMHYVKHRELASSKGAAQINLPCILLL